jgi:hypothetical protein
MIAAGPPAAETGPLTRIFSEQPCAATILVCMGWLRLFVPGMIVCAAMSAAQSLGGGSTVGGVVTDPSGAVIPHAEVVLMNRATNYSRSAVTDEKGSFQFGNVPPNPYHVSVSAPGFSATVQDIDVRSSVPVSMNLTLPVAGGTTSVTVEEHGPDLIENVPYAHNDVDTHLLSSLPPGSPAGGLSDAVVLSAPGVVADSNGSFHPLGDHAQVTFSIDGQPISDQQSKQFSTQFPVNALQSMEMISGAPPVEFGDKTSLIVNAITRSGLGLAHPTGDFTASYGSFGGISEEAGFGIGSAKLGNYVVVNTLRNGRFLDTPEFFPMHDIGNSQTVFDRLDYQPAGTDALHANLFFARNWFQVPNTYDQPNQDQRQRVVTLNFAPSYQHTYGATTVLSVDPFIRQDRVNYFPSRDPFSDQPATIDQERRLTNWGTRVDVSHIHGAHNFKTGVQLMQTRLSESFGFGVTDPAFNAVCVDSAGTPQGLPAVTNPLQCAGLGLASNPGLQPGLLPFDLTRGGSLFRFNGTGNVNEFAFYAQDSITWRGLNVIGGVRVDRYDGIGSATGVQPRIGLSYHLRPTATVLRAAYSRTFETPYNENLLLSSATGAGGLAANTFGALASAPLRPGTRNQFNAGFQQVVARFLIIDADYFWKFTTNAYDFDTLFNTPIVFPISWRKSKLDGASIRVSTPTVHGFQAYTNIGHTRARYFGPENGGLIFNSPVDASVFRIDHDQAFQQTTSLHYQRPKNGPWASFVWRYDSGEVAGSIATLNDALSLTAAQQAAIGFFCGGQTAALASPITSCASPDYGATRLQIPAAGTANADHNPPRIAPRHLFDIGVGTDNLFHTERVRTTLRFTVANLTNNVALYNFLSTFSGTHFVAPRTFQVSAGLAF